MSLNLDDPTDRIVAINKLLPEITLFLKDILPKEQLSEDTKTRCEEFVEKLQELLKPPLPPRTVHKTSTPEVFNTAYESATSEEYLSKQRQLSRQAERWTPGAFHHDKKHSLITVQKVPPTPDQKPANASDDDEVVYERIGSTNSASDPELNFDRKGSYFGNTFEDDAPPVPERTNRKTPTSNKAKRSSPLLRKKGVIRRVVGKGGSNPNLVLDSKILPHDLPNPQCSGPLKDLKNNCKVWCYLKDQQLFMFHDFGKPVSAVVDMREYKIQTEPAWKNRFQLYRSSYPSLYFAAESDDDFEQWYEALRNPKADYSENNSLASATSESSGLDSDYERPLDVISKITDKKYASEGNLVRHEVLDPGTSDDDLYLRVKSASPQPDYYTTEVVDAWKNQRKKSLSHDGSFNYKDAPLPPVPQDSAKRGLDAGDGRAKSLFPPIEKLDKDGYLMMEGTNADGVFRSLGSSSSLSGSFESVSSGDDQAQSRESLLEGDLTGSSLRNAQRTEKEEKEFQFLHDLSSTYSGVLYYRRLLAVWQKRYCKVKDQTLLCYRNPSLDESPLLEIPLVGYKVDLADKETWKGNSFKLIKPGCDVLYFATPSQESLRKWLSAIVKEIDRERFNLPTQPGVEAEINPVKPITAALQMNTNVDSGTDSVDDTLDRLSDDSDAPSVGARSRSSSHNDDLAEGKVKMARGMSSNEQIMAYQGYMVEVPCGDESTIDGCRVTWAVADNDCFKLYEDETKSALLVETSTREMKVAEMIDLDEGTFGFEVDFGHDEVRLFRIEKQREFFIWSDVLTNTGCELRKAELNNRKRHSLILWPSNELQSDAPEESRDYAVPVPIGGRMDLRHRKRIDESRQSRSLDRTESEKRAMQMALHRSATAQPKKVATLPASIGKKQTSSSRVSSIFKSLTRRKYDLDTVANKQIKSIQSSNDQMPKEVFNGPLIELVLHSNGDQTRSSRHGRVSGKMFYLYENDKDVKPLLKIPLKNASLEEFVDATQNVYRFTITSMEDNIPHVMCVRTEADVEAWMSAMVTLAFQNVRSADAANLSLEGAHSSDEARPCKSLVKTPLSRIQSTPSAGSSASLLSSGGDTLERKRKTSKESSSSSLNRRYMDGYLFELHAAELSSTKVRRWCVVTATSLSVYRARDEMRCLKTLDFATYSPTTSNDQSKQKWSIVLRSANETVSFVAVDKSTHAKWTEAIRQACKKRSRSGSEINRLKTTADHLFQFLQPSNRSGSYALSDKDANARESMLFNEKDQAAIDSFAGETTTGISGTLTEVRGGSTKNGKPHERYCYIREGNFVVCKQNRPDKEVYRIELAVVGILDESDPDNGLYQFRLDYKRGQFVVFRAPDQSTAEKWMVAVSMGMLLQRLQSSNKPEVYPESQDDYNFVSLSDDWSLDERSAPSSPTKKTLPSPIDRPLATTASATLTTSDAASDGKRKVSAGVGAMETIPDSTESPTSSSPSLKSPTDADRSIPRASEVVTYPDRQPGPFMQNMIRQQSESGNPSSQDDGKSSFQSPINSQPLCITSNAASHAEMNKLNRRKESLEGERVRLVRLLSESRQLVQMAKKRRNSSKSSDESVIFDEELKTSKHDLDSLKKRLHDVDKEIQTVSAEINRKVFKAIKHTRKTSTPIAPALTKKTGKTPTLVSCSSLPGGTDVFDFAFTGYPNNDNKRS